MGELPSIKINIPNQPQLGGIQINDNKPVKQMSGQKTDGKPIVGFEVMSKSPLSGVVNEKENKDVEEHPDKLMNNNTKVMQQKNLQRDIIKWQREAIEEPSGDVVPGVLDKLGSAQKHCKDLIVESLSVRLAEVEDRQKGNKSITANVRREEYVRSETFRSLVDKAKGELSALFSRHESGEIDAKGLLEGLGKAMKQLGVAERQVVAELAQYYLDSGELIGTTKKYNVGISFQGRQNELHNELKDILNSKTPVGSGTDAAKELEKKMGVLSGKLVNQLNDTRNKALELAALAIYEADLSGLSLKEVRAKLEKDFPHMDLARIPAEKRQLVTELRDHHLACKRIEDKLVQRSHGEVDDSFFRGLDDKEGTYLEITTDNVLKTANLKDIETLRSDIKARAGETMKTFTPSALQKLWGASRMSGVKARECVSDIGRQFRNKVATDPALKLDLQLGTDVVKKSVERYVSGLKLSGKYRKELKANLLRTVEQNTFNPKDLIQSTQKLGFGASGSVYSGTYRGMNVVVKGSASDHGSSLLRELLPQLMGVGNPNLPKIIGVMVDETNKAHIVMEKVTGFDLEDVAFIFNEKANTFKKGLSSLDKGKMAVHIARGMIKGLEPLHAQNIAHLDIKPNNLMFDKVTRQVQVVDLGEAMPGKNVVSGSNTGYTKYSGKGANERTAMQYDVFCIGVSLVDYITGDSLERLGAQEKFMEEKFTEETIKKLNIDMSKEDWLLPTGGIDKDGKEILFHDIWKDETMAPVKDAIAILCDSIPGNRPTMDQLLDIVEGRTPPLAADGVDGVKDLEALGTLIRVFGPGSQFNGGGDVLFNLGQARE